MLSRRLIACLDVANGAVVKGVQFESLRTIGDPVVRAEQYENDGADEIVFLNIAATSGGEDPILDLVTRTADRLFIPLTVGGGISSIRDIGEMLRAGADKVSINSAAVATPRLLTEAADRFGAQCVVVSIDARREEDRWRVYTHGGRKRTDLDAIDWAVQCVELGAGEILLTSIDRDGTRSGFDLSLTREVASEVRVPVIASGGGGTSSHVVEAFHEGHADAALLAGVIHDGALTIGEIKAAMRNAGIPVRLAA